MEFIQIHQYYTMALRKLVINDSPLWNGGPGRRVDMGHTYSYDIHIHKLWTFMTFFVGTEYQSCDFQPDDLCNYQQASTDDFDWTQGSGSTLTPGTGPIVDHTFGTSSGLWT